MAGIRTAHEKVRNVAVRTAEDMTGNNPIAHTATASPHQVRRDHRLLPVIQATEHRSPFTDDPIRIADRLPTWRIPRFAEIGSP